MTPKEKAIELFDKYYHQLKFKEVFSYVYNFEHCKKCALIAVEEILDDDVFDMSEELFENRINYWEQVKYEIINL